MEHNNNHIHVWKIGASLGITWGLYLLFFAWAAAFFNGWGQSLVEVLGSFYIGYAPTFIGGIVGFVWGFFCAGIFGIIFSWIYNKLI